MDMFIHNRIVNYLIYSYYSNELHLYDVVCVNVIFLEL